MTGRHDLLYKWLTAAVTSLHWFNPLMYLVRREVARRCELSCDEAVLHTLDQRGRRRYGETLLALAAPPPPRGPSILNSETGDGQRYRSRRRRKGTPP